MKLRLILVLVFFLSLGIGLIPQGTCQNTGNVDINAYTTISGIDFKNGIVTFSSLYLSIDANESFVVYIFTTALPSPTWESNQPTYDNVTRIYSLHEQEFPNGFQLKFSLGGCLTLVDDKLECGIAIGLNITSSYGTKNVYPSLDFSLQNDWDVNGTIKEATSQEASQYALYGMYAINQSIANQSIANSSLTQFYVVKIDVTRKTNWNNFILYWIPPILMFVLLFASLKLVIERDLANSLLVYVATAIFAFGYLSTLRDITPPMVTSLEGLTLVDVSFSFIFSITSILRRRPKEHEEQTRGSGMNRKEPEDEILPIVQWIDDKRTEQTKLFRKNDSLGGEMTRLVVGLLVLFFVMWIITYEYGVSLVFKGLSGFDAAIAASSVLLPVLALVIAGLALFSPYLEKNQVEVRYNRALKLRKKEVESSGKESELNDFTENEKPFLKALIEIGSKNERFTLRQLYDLDKTKAVFSKEKLLERLCK